MKAIDKKGALLAVVAVVLLRGAKEEVRWWYYRPTVCVGVVVKGWINKTSDFTCMRSEKASACHSIDHGVWALGPLSAVVVGSLELEDEPCSVQEGGLTHRQMGCRWHQWAHVKLKYIPILTHLNTSLQSPEICPRLLKYKIRGKAQEVIAVPPLEDSLKYESVRAAILRVYELVRDKNVEIIKKPQSRLNVEFARENRSLFENRMHCSVPKWTESELSCAAVWASKCVLSHKTAFPSSSVEKSSPS